MIHQDKDGLIPTTEVLVRNRRYFHCSEELFIDPGCGAVADYLLQDLSLWSAARLRFNHTDIRRKGAPIIGVSFGHALRQAFERPFGLSKAMFEHPEWTSYKGKVVVATMLAHTSATPVQVEFQAWQFLDISPETFYVHAIISKSSLSVVHLDGATMLHSVDQQTTIRKTACKVKGNRYTKHFRIDGAFPISVAADLLDRYFPIQPLTREFIEATK